MAQFTASDSIDELTRLALEAALNQDTVEKNAPPYQSTPLSVLAHDKDGTLIGGLTGATVWDWLYIDMLWVKKEARAQGVGGNLIKHAESIALERGCHSSYLWTESFQAPDFYPQLGYQKFVVQQDFPVGHQRIGFMKPLTS